MSADPQRVPLTSSGTPDGSGGRALSANVRRLHNALNLLLGDLEREQFIHCLNVYHAKRNVFDLVQTLKVILNTSSKRQLLPQLRLVIPRADQLLFDQYTSEGLYLKTRPGGGRAEGDATLQKYVSSLREQPLTCQGSPATAPQLLHGPSGDVRKVTLTRCRSREGLGFSIRGGAEHGVGIYVSLVEPGSLAQREGLRVGDQILTVNDVTFDDVSHAEAVKVLKGCKQLGMSVCSMGRVPGGYITNHVYSWVDPEGRSVSPPPDSQEAEQKQAHGVEERTANLNMEGGRSLGLMIRGGAEYGLGIYITGVDPGSAADAGALKVGDQIMEVNSQSFLTISHDEAVQILKTGRQLLVKVRDVGRLPHARTLMDETKWICGRPIAESNATAKPSPGSDPAVPVGVQRCVNGSACSSRPTSAKAVLGKPAAHRGVGPPGAQVSLEQQAFMLLTEPERQTMAYYLQEYQDAHIQVEPLAMALFELFNTHAKLSMLSEVRSLVAPQDLQLYDRLVLHREREEAHQSWHRGPGAPHAQGHCDHAASVLHAQGHCDQAASVLHAQSHCDHAASVLHAQGHCDHAASALHAQGHCDHAASALHAQGHCDQAASVLHAQGHCDHAASALHAQGHCDQAASALHAQGHCNHAASALHAQGHCDQAASALHAQGQCDHAASALHAQGHCDHAASALHAQGHCDQAASVLHAQGHCDQAASVLHAADHTLPATTGGTLGGRKEKQQEQNLNVFKDIKVDEMQASDESSPFSKTALFLAQSQPSKEKEHNQKPSTQRLQPGLLFTGPTWLLQDCLHKSLKALPSTQPPSPVSAHRTCSGASHHASLNALHHTCQSSLQLSKTEHQNSPHFAHHFHDHAANHSRAGSGHRTCPGFLYQSSSSAKPEASVQLASRSSSYEKSCYLSKSASSSKAASPMQSPHPSPHLTPCPSPCPSRRPAFITSTAPPCSADQPCSPAFTRKAITTDMNRLSADSTQQQRGATLSQLSDSGQTLSEDSGVDIAEAGGLSKDGGPRPCKNQQGQLEQPGTHALLPGTRQSGSPVPTALLVRVVKNANTLGIAIEGGANTRQPLPRIVTIQKGGSAHSCGQLKVGQVILEVNGVPLRGREHKEAAQIIAEAFQTQEKDHVHFLVVEPGL